MTYPAEHFPETPLWAQAAVSEAIRKTGLTVAKWQVPLEAIYVWWLLPQHSLGPDLPGHITAEEAQEESRRMLAELMAGWVGKYPDVPVQLRAVHAMNPSHTLIEASREAGLVVVGSRGRGGFAGLLLGSVSRDLVGHAHCPVAVVHPRKPR